MRLKLEGMTVLRSSLLLALFVSAHSQWEVASTDVDAVSTPAPQEVQPFDNRRASELAVAAPSTEEDSESLEDLNIASQDSSMLPHEEKQKSVVEIEEEKAEEAPLKTDVSSENLEKEGISHDEESDQSADSFVPANLSLAFLPSPENPFAGHRHPTVPHAAIVRPSSFPYVFRLAVDKRRSRSPSPTQNSSDTSPAPSSSSEPFFRSSMREREFLPLAPSSSLEESEVLLPPNPAVAESSAARSTCLRKCAFFLWIAEPGGGGGAAFPDGDFSRHWQILSKRLARAAWEDLFETVVVYAPLFQVQLLSNHSPAGLREYAGWIAAQLNAFLPQTLGSASTEALLFSDTRATQQLSEGKEESSRLEGKLGSAGRSSEKKGESSRHDIGSASSASDFEEDPRAVLTGCGLWDFFVEGWGEGANAARLLFLRNGRLWLGASASRSRGSTRAVDFGNVRRLQQLLLSLEAQGKLRLRTIAFHAAPLAGLGSAGSAHAFSKDSIGKLAPLASAVPGRMWKAVFGGDETKELLRVDRDRLLCRLAQEEKRNYVEGLYGGGSLMAAFDSVLYFGYSDAGAGISPNTQLGLPDALVVSLESVAKALAARQEMMNRFFFVDEKDSCANQTRADRPVKLCMGRESVRSLLLDDEACTRVQGHSLQILTLAFLALHVANQTPKSLRPFRYLAGRGGWVEERVHWTRKMWGVRPQLNLVAARRLLTQPVVRLLHSRSQQELPFDGDHNSVMHLFWFGRPIAEDAPRKREHGAGRRRNAS